MMNSFTINNTTIYIKQIPEDITELLTTATKYDQQAIAGITSARRQKEILIANQVIRHLFGNNAVLLHSEYGVPILDGININITISHCKNKFIIAINPTNIIGIDIELQREQLNRIKNRFLSAQELIAYNTPVLLLKAWTIKEAIYKAALTPGLSLSKHINILSDNNTATVLTPERIKHFQIHTILSSEEECISLAIQNNN